jgi:hypothetical protein
MRMLTYEKSEECMGPTRADKWGKVIRTCAVLGLLRDTHFASCTRPGREPNARTQFRHAQHCTAWRSKAWLWSIGVDLPLTRNGLRRKWSPWCRGGLG